MEWINYDYDYDYDYDYETETQFTKSAMSIVTYGQWASSHMQYSP
jgi:hypothetical protein